MAGRDDPLLPLACPAHTGLLLPVLLAWNNLILYPGPPVTEGGAVAAPQELELPSMSIFFFPSKSCPNIAKAGVFGAFLSLAGFLAWPTTA